VLRDEQLHVAGTPGPGGAPVRRTHAPTHPGHQHCQHPHHHRTQQVLYMPLYGGLMPLPHPRHQHCQHAHHHRPHQVLFMPLYGGLMPLLILGTSIANTLIITVLIRYCSCPCTVASCPSSSTAPALPTPSSSPSSSGTVHAPVRWHHAPPHPRHQHCQPRVG
jgi:hypothetical protein